MKNIPANLLMTNIL